MCENPKVFIQPEPEFPALTSSVYMSTRPPSAHCAPGVCTRGVHGSLGLSLGVACACYFSKSPNYDGIITSTRVGNDNYLPLQKASKFPRVLCPAYLGGYGANVDEWIFIITFSSSFYFHPWCLFFIISVLNSISSKFKSKIALSPDWT